MLCCAVLYGAVRVASRASAKPREGFFRVIRRAESVIGLTHGDAVAVIWPGCVGVGTQNKGSGGEAAVVLGWKRMRERRWEKDGQESRSSAAERGKAHWSWPAAKNWPHTLDMTLCLYYCYFCVYAVTLQDEHAASEFCS